MKTPNEMFFDRLDLLDTEVANPVHGMLCMANAQSFQNIHFSEPLTAYAQGWRDPSDLQGMLDFLFPPVQVSARFEYRQHNALEDFEPDSDDERSINGDFKAVKTTGAIAQAKTANRGVTLFLDDDLVREIPNWQQLYTGRLLRRCVRNDLYRGVALLVAAATNTGKTWSAGTDADADGINLVKSCADLIGFAPNRVAFFGAALQLRLIALRGSDKPAVAASSAINTPDGIAQFWGARRGMDISARVKSGAAKATIAGANYVLPFYAEDGVGPEDPSATKRFWSPCGDGGQYRVYVRQVSEKRWAVTVERYNLLAVTSSLGLAKYTISAGG